MSGDYSERISMGYHFQITLIQGKYYYPNKKMVYRSIVSQPNPTIVTIYRLHMQKQPT